MNNTKIEFNQNKIYVSTIPNWLKFFTFIKRGFYNGNGWKANFSRIFCWFDKHEYTFFLRSVEVKKVKFYETQLEKEGYELNFTLQCRHCGHAKNFSGQYRNFDEHRII